MTTEGTIRLAILGTGGMAGRHVEAFGAMEGVTVVAGIDIVEDQLVAFCDRHGIETRFNDLSQALEWGAFDAVANVTPDKVHHATTLQCLSAGKHVFCEKPLATNHTDAAEMTEAAGRAQKVAMVNLTYRNVPAVQKARQMVSAGDIGEIRHVEASYLQSWLTANHWGNWRTEPKWLWRLSTEHGSNGVVGDIGIHILDFASYGAVSEISDMTCRTRTFAKAENDRIGDYTLDANDSFVMSVEFANGALGTIHASRWASGYADDLRLRLFGSLGGLEVDYGGRPAGGERTSTLMACLGEDLHTQTWREIEVPPVETNYERFVRAIREGHTLEPSFAHATDLQKLLDRAIAVEKPAIANAG